MERYPQLSFTVGMPNMAPDQLSEVELLKILAEFQWTQIGAALQCPPHELVNDADERLYASVVQVECSFGPNKNISQFQEGDVVHARGNVRFYAKQFVEGWAVFDKQEIPRETLADLRTAADLSKLSSPWMSMTNAIVARMADNNRLKTFRPAGIEDLEVPEAPEQPLGLTVHQQVMQDGRIDSLVEHRNLVPLRPVDPSPIVYRIALENDLNGAGLLYFVRYIAMMNYAERIFLTKRQERPFSLPLIPFFSTEHRRTYFFANASQTDEVLVYCTGAAIDPGRAPRPVDATRTEAMRFQFRFDLYRRLDGVLMASSLVTRSLTIPNRFKNLCNEAGRFAEMLMKAGA